MDRDLYAHDHKKKKLRERSLGWCEEAIHIILFIPRILRTFRLGSLPERQFPKKKASPGEELTRHTERSD
jgi:hypothetical protein